MSNSDDAEVEEQLLEEELPNALSPAARWFVGVLAIGAFTVGGLATFLTVNQWAAVAFVAIGAFLLITALMGEVATEIRAGGDRAVVRFANRVARRIAEETEDASSEEQAVASRLLRSLERELPRSRRATWRVRARLPRFLEPGGQELRALEESVAAAVDALEYEREPAEKPRGNPLTFVSPRGNTVAVVPYVFDRSRRSLVTDFRMLDGQLRRCLDAGVRHAIVAARWAAADGQDRVLMPFLVREHGEVIGVATAYVDWPALDADALPELRNCVAYLDGEADLPSG